MFFGAVPSDHTTTVFCGAAMQPPATPSTIAAIRNCFIVFIC
jgi:hypothetical protein